MASKNLWIVGGIVIAIAAVAYIGFTGSPAVNDGAGTIVQAKRAQTDGTNSFNPSSNANATDERANTDSAGTSDQRGEKQRAREEQRANGDQAGPGGGSHDRAADNRADERPALATTVPVTTTASRSTTAAIDCGCLGRVLAYRAR